MIIAITGASGVGKTFATKELSKNLPENVRVYHFDDIGMPDWSKLEDSKKWQEDTTAQWIDKLVKVAREEKVDVVFEGSTEIRFYIENFAKNNYTEYEILLFDCTEKTMKERLIQRGQAELYQPDMVNWLNYLRKDAILKNVEIVKTDDKSVNEIGQIIKNKLN